MRVRILSELQHPPTPWTNSDKYLFSINIVFDNIYELKAFDGTNHDLTAVKALMFFRKITIHITTEAPSPNSNFKGRTSLISSFFSANTWEGTKDSSPLRLQKLTLFPMKGNKLVKLKARVTVTETLLNERKLFPSADQRIYFSD